jgi:tRNA threonylcarbamoyladenosine biosynthesis protein TsaE
MSYTYISNSPEDTNRLAALLAQWLVPGCVVALEGDLGAGKTTFSQAFARGLGVREIVSSPTFTIIKEYEGERCPFYHMDVYRLTVEEADELGLDDYFFGDGITLVEWASRIEEIMPQERLQMTMTRADSVNIGLEDGASAEEWEADKRIIEITAFGSFYEEGCRALAQQGVWR